MPRPKKRRVVAGEPPVGLFKPAGIPGQMTEAVKLSLEEFEALRLCDYQGHSHEESALHIGVSRQTFGRIVDSARRKTAKALTLGLALRISGGDAIFTRDFERREGDGKRRNGQNKRNRCGKCGKYLIITGGKNEDSNPSQREEND